MLKQVLIAALALSAVAASAQDRAASRWVVKQTPHELDGSVDYSVTNVSEHPLIGVVGQPEPAVLFAICSRNGLSIGVAWPDIVERFVSINSAALAWSVDGGKVHNDLWDADIQTVGVRGGKARKLIASLTAANRFVILVPDQHGNQEAVFDLGGAQAAFATLPCAKS
jgi:hypothetical protein